MAEDQEQKYCKKIKRNTGWTWELETGERAVAVKSKYVEHPVAKKSNLENYKRFLKLQWSLFPIPDKNVLKSFYNFLSFFGDARMVGWKLQTPNMGEGRPFYWLFPVEISDVIQHVQR